MNHSLLSRDGSRGPALPAPAGPLSEAVVAVLCGQGDPLTLAVEEGRAETENVLGSDDLQLALYLLYELHYQGFADVSEEWEWNPALLAHRRELEGVFAEGLVGAVGPAPSAPGPGPGAAPCADDMDLALRGVLEADDGPSLSRYVETRATLDQFLEFVVHRSAYQLKEADPHSWAIPRLTGVPKAALIEIQADEYGEGVADRMHASLFAQTMNTLGLDSNYGSYLSLLPGVTLATVNLMSFFGLHRRWRGALVGHLAAFEMSSSLPNRRYSNGLDRLGGTPQARAFYEEHVVADAVHENIAAVDLAGGLARQRPELAPDILFGARTLVELDRRFGAYVLGAWEAGRSSLRAPAAELAATAAQGAIGSGS